MGRHHQPLGRGGGVRWPRPNEEFVSDLCRALSSQEEVVLLELWIGVEEGSEEIESVLGCGEVGVDATLLWLVDGVALYAAASEVI